MLPLLASLLTATLASGSTAAELRYALGPGMEVCPDQSFVEDHVKARLGWDPWHQPAEVVFDVEVQGSGRAKVAVLQQRNAQGRSLGHRQFRSEGGDCDALMHSVAMAISIVLDTFELARVPEEKPDEPPPPVQPEPAPPVPPVPARVQPPPPRRSPPMPKVEKAGPPWWRRLGWRGDVHYLAEAGSLVSVGMQPSPTVGGMVSAGLQLDRLSLSLESRAMLPSIQPASVGRVYMGTLSLGAVPCVHGTVWRGCMVTSVSTTVLRAARQASVDRTHSEWAALGPRLVLQVPLRWGLVVGALVESQARVPRLVLREARTTDTLWESPPVLLTGGLFAGGDLP